MAWSESRQPPAVASRTYPPFEKNEADTEGSFIARSAGETSELQILQWEWHNLNSTTAKP